MSGPTASPRRSGLKANRRFELGAILAVVTLYVGMAHVAAAERMAHALLAAGAHVSPALLGYVVLLVVVRFLVVVILPGVIAARLGLLAWAWVAVARTPVRAERREAAGAIEPR